MLRTFFSAPDNLYEADKLVLILGMTISEKFSLLIRAETIYKKIQALTGWVRCPINLGARPHQTIHKYTMAFGIGTYELSPTDS